MFLFKLFDQGLQELLLSLQLLNFSLNLKSDILLNLSLIHLVTTHLRVKLPVPYGSKKKPSQIKCVAKVNTSLLVSLCLRVLLPETE